MKTSPTFTEKNKERITLELGVNDGWVCICGNTPADDGFAPCNKNGDEVEPVEGWEDLYVCLNCGAIIDQETLDIVGKNRNPKRLD